MVNSRNGEQAKVLFYMVSKILVQEVLTMAHMTNKSLCFQALVRWACTLVPETEALNELKQQQYAIRCSAQQGIYDMDQHPFKGAPVCDMRKKQDRNLEFGDRCPKLKPCCSAQAKVETSTLQPHGPDRSFDWVAAKELIS